MEHPMYAIWLSLVCGPASPAPAKLFTVFRNPREVYEAEPEALDEVPGLAPELKRALRNKNLDGPRQILRFCLDHNIGLLSYHDKQYPPRLRRIDTPPVLLYYRGSLPDFENLVCIAVVGTRKAPENARQSAYTISRDLTLAGATVVSGMALGVDGAAAAGALDAGGHTVAVLGSGIDVVYPPQHEQLMNRIMVGGTVLTELPPHSEPAGKNFPIRNRIISGLCNGTLVVSGDFKSGSLITARHATEQGRDLFAVPGDIQIPESEGPNSLIKDGAHMVTCAEDIVMEYETLYSHTLDVNRMRRLRRELFGMGEPERSALKVAATRKPENFYAGYRPDKPGKRKEEKKSDDAPPREKRPDPERAKRAECAAVLPERERRVFDAMPADLAVTSDDLAGTGIPVSDVLVAMTMLEIDGLIEALPGGLYKKKPC